VSRSGDVERFGWGRRGFAVLFGLLAFTGIALGTWYAVAEGRGAYGAFWVLFGLVHAASALLHARQHVTLTDAALGVTNDLRTRWIPWSDVEHVTVDWAAAAGGRDADAFRVDRTNGSTLRSIATRNLTGGAAGTFEAALRRRADEHGFDVEVHRPSWTER
jgi:hypothetical protein